MPSDQSSEILPTPPGGVASRRGSLDLNAMSAAVMAAAVAAAMAARNPDAERMCDGDAEAKRQKVSEGKHGVAAE